MFCRDQIVKLHSMLVMEGGGWREGRDVTLTGWGAWVINIMR